MKYRFGNVVGYMSHTCENRVTILVYSFWDNFNVDTGVPLMSLRKYGESWIYTLSCIVTSTCMTSRNVTLSASWCFMVMTFSMTDCLVASSICWYTLRNTPPLRISKSCVKWYTIFSLRGMVMCRKSCHLVRGCDVISNFLNTLCISSCICIL